MLGLEVLVQQMIIPEVLVEIQLLATLNLLLRLQLWVEMVEHREMAPGEAEEAVMQELLMRLYWIKYLFPVE